MTIYYTYCSYETDKGDAGLMYIGSRKCPKDKTPWTDNYFGSQKSKKNQDFKNNPDKSKFVLGIFDSAEMAIAHEIELHEANDVAGSPRFANQAKQTSTGFSTSGVKFSPETCQKMSESRKGEKNGSFGKGELFSGEKNPFFGKNHKPETIQKISESLRGRTLSNETRKKLSGPRPNFRGENHPMYGKESHNKGMKHRPETRQQMSEAKKGEKHPNFDHTLYDFENKELGIVELQVTRYYLWNKYGLNSGNLGSLVRGDYEHHKGWVLAS